MKKYIKLNIESNSSSIEIKVEHVYCIERNETIFSEVTTEYTPTKGDKLYFLPGVNVPRIKLKDLSLNYGIKTVRNIDDATNIFIAKTTRDKITNSEWYHALSATKLQEIYENKNLPIDDYYLENIRQALDFNTEDKVIMTYGNANEIRYSNHEEFAKYADYLISSNIFYTIDEDYADLPAKLENVTLYDESAILKHINGDDAAVIDEVMFEQINQMFESNDKDNHVLAMEIMANSNYVESLLFLEMLFKEHSYEISNCHTKNHVNFKSLIGYLKKNKSYLGTSLDDIINSLIDKGVLSTDKLDMLMKRYADEIQSHGCTNHFKVKTITISDDLLKDLNTNYAYQHVEDFIPELIEDYSSGVAGVALEVESTNEAIEETLEEMPVDEAEEDLINIEESETVSESELNKLEPELNNTETTQTNDTDFDWF